MHAPELITTRAAFAALEAEWNSLADRIGDPLLRHDWFTACAETFARDGDLRIFIVRDETGLRAAAPLVKDGAGPLARLKLLGFQVMEPQALLHDDEGALRAVCSAALSAGLPVSLPRIAAEAPETAVLNELGRAKGLRVLRTATTQTHATALQRDFAAFEKSMASRQASIIRRRRKRLGEEHGAVTFEAFSPGESEAEAALADLLRVEAAGWKARNGTSMLHDRRMGRFIGLYARLAARAGLLRVFNLRVGGEVVAGQMVVEHAGSLWGIKLGADERFYKYGVGVMVTHDIMRWAAERDLKTFEHLGVAEDYQRRWPLIVREQSTFRFYPTSASGGVALTTDTIDFVRRRARRLRRRLAAPPQAPAAAAEEAVA